MAPFTPWFSHAGGHVAGRPPIASYEIEAGHLAERASAARAAGRRDQAALLDGHAARFAATARRLRWQADVTCTGGA